MELGVVEHNAVEYVQLPKKVWLIYVYINYNAHANADAYYTGRLEPTMPA